MRRCLAYACMPCAMLETADVHLRHHCMAFMNGWLVQGGVARAHVCVGTAAEAHVVQGNWNLPSPYLYPAQPAHLPLRCLQPAPTRAPEQPLGTTRHGTTAPRSTCTVRACKHACGCPVNPGSDLLAKLPMTPQGDVRSPWFPHACMHACARRQPCWHKARARHHLAAMCTTKRSTHGKSMTKEDGKWKPRCPHLPVMKMTKGPQRHQATTRTSVTVLTAVRR